MNYFDFHCDTAYEMFHRHVGLTQNGLAVSLDGAAKIFAHYAQVMAIWSDRRLDDETCYTRFLEICDNLDREVSANAEKVTLVTSGKEIEDAWKNGKTALIRAVEDARLLCGDISRLDELHRRGVRILTLQWSGETCLGGAHNTGIGLSPFGAQVTARCFETGIIPDLSHASEKEADDVCALATAAGKPVIATHSDSHEICPHTRNLRDRHFTAIASLGGLVGLNLYPAFLNGVDAPCAVDAVLPHIEHFLALGGEDALCFGCDFDGASLPRGMTGVETMNLAADLLLNRYSAETVDKIFWKNALHFAAKNLK